MDKYIKPNEEQILEIYKKYLKCFQNKDFEGLEKVVSENVIFYWGADMKPLIGRDEFFGFFKKCWEYFTERPEASDISVHIPMLRAKIHNRIEVFRDWIDNPFKNLGVIYKAGDIDDGEAYVEYCFDAYGKIALIIAGDYMAE